ncbi:MAG: hypothetical protein HUJ86_03215 [Synergistes sp.]|nr:hypothetical protein [Synergistes sp.]
MAISNTDTLTAFAITYEFFDELRVTEIAMLVNGDNILSFERDGKLLTTRWNLDEIAFWLREFIDHMSEDPYPIEAAGEYAAIKDINAREFDTDNEIEFDAYYDRLDEWNLRHRWHPASGGAILSDLYFQLVGDNVEISWNNQYSETGVRFKYELGGVRIPKEKFVGEVDKFLKAYADHWFKL